MSDSESSLPVKFSPTSANSADYWEEHIENWHRSGLKQSAYCRLHNLNYRRFCKWKAKFESDYPSRSSIKLVEVKAGFTHCAGPNTTSSFTVSTPSSSGMPPRISRDFSGIRFWCGEFCIEVDVQFSTTSMSALIQTLRSLAVGPQSEPGLESGNM
jgi:hypothetical protein